jgi:hypothetical protein
VKRFESALEVLKNDGIAQGWCYADNRELPVRNRLPAWLDRLLIFEPCAEVKPVLQHRSFSAMAGGRSE